VYGRAWEKARQAALSIAEALSLLAERPYDLRHARLSTWLSGLARKFVGGQVQAVGSLR
jgi:hypothetical protein